MPRKPEKPKAYTNGPGWFVRYTFQGKRRDHALYNDDAERVTTARGAAAAVDHMWALMGKGIDPRPEGATVKGLVADYLKALKNAPRTIEEKRRMLGLFSAWAAERKIPSAREVSDRDAAAYLDGLPGGPRWRNLTRSYLSHAWGWAKLPNVWEQTEAAKVERRRKPTIAPVTWERIERAAHPHHRLMFRFHFATGMRPGEVCALRWADLDLGRGLVTVFTLKGMKERLIPLPEDLTLELTLLAAWLACYQAITGRGVLGGAVFINRLGKRFQPTPYNKELRSTCDRASVPRVNAHMFRHTAITEWLQGGMDLGTARDLAGHHSIAVTDIYSHASAELAREVVGKRAKKKPH
jgi:integrase